MLQNQDRINKAEIARVKECKPQLHSLLRTSTDYILLSLSSDSADWRSSSS